ncbi:MAG: SDR family oxidoreductase, partial [Gammaproteobacteria bacterium]|nr:SDR family oxidoreductase [Gammaproteobacteria bacterium]
NVNSIAPGFIRSDSSYRAMAEDDPLRQQMAAAIPGKSQGPPHDLVGALLLLVSPAGEWINGQTVHVDGGWVTRM